MIKQQSEYVLKKIAINQYRFSSIWLSLSGKQGFNSSTRAKLSMSRPFLAESGSTRQRPRKEVGALKALWLRIQVNKLKAFKLSGREVTTTSHPWLELSFPSGLRNGDLTLAPPQP